MRVQGQYRQYVIASACWVFEMGRLLPSTLPDLSILSSLRCDFYHPIHEHLNLGRLVDQIFSVSGRVLFLGAILATTGHRRSKYEDPFASTSSGPPLTIAKTSQTGQKTRHRLTYRTQSPPLRRYPDCILIRSPMPNAE